MNFFIRTNRLVLLVICSISYKNKLVQTRNKNELFTNIFCICYLLNNVHGLNNCKDVAIQIVSSVIFDNLPNFTKLIEFEIEFNHILRKSCRNFPQYY